MVRIKTEVPIFLIVFDLLFQMQEKSRRSISKKGRNARFLIIVKLDQPGRYDLFCLIIIKITLKFFRFGFKLVMWYNFMEIHVGHFFVPILGMS